MALPKLYRALCPFVVLAVVLAAEMARTDPAVARSGSSHGSGQGSWNSGTFETGTSEVRCGKRACKYDAGDTKGQRRAAKARTKTGLTGHGGRPRYLLE